MTKEEKQKAIDALKISVPIKALTQEEFNSYIQTLNQIMDWLEQEPTTKNNRGVDCSLDDFIKYCKRTFGVELTVKKSDNPDTYAKLFGTTKNDLDVDAVSRQAVIDMTGLSEWFDSSDSYNEFVIALSEMPSVTPQEPRWIPVSERLPKIADVYLVTRYYPNNVMNPKYIVDACCFDGSNTWYNDNRINHERAYANNVIAWQENPEPYKAESEEYVNFADDLIPIINEAESEDEKT